MRLTRTCNAYPTQYDVLLDDGRYAYFRYRNDYWSLELYAEKDDFLAPDWNDKLLADIGADYVARDGTSGHMTHSEVMGLFEIALPTLLAKAAP